ncbi:DNA topoisomerase IV subunit A [Spiroplasma endosymbiont of Aspidapion aeneum]|uniref:DNA topoisomerase IV subunit A n=1 Tax=Spiroplasma endosymbiont of Aspidapion aeneum TaxID=3066276 RepID=UPI00313C7494
MAKNILDNEQILVQPFEDVIGERFGRYAKYIIQERALPDVRDGLKPVQRRVLYAMNEINLTHDKPYKKSARIVGDVIGKYHPHGDTSVYEALVRMSQSWKLNMPLVDMHGNNGSIDGDSAAAMRYTESRLSKISSLLLDDLEKNTVKFAPNFDDSESEPIVLPSYFPNILVNGSTGIAAGYATNMPPHNLREIIDALILIIKKDDVKDSEIFKIVKGPDFPTGSIAMGREGIESAFRTGKGRVIVQSKVHHEDGMLVIDEIPYEVVKQDLVRKIGDVVEANPSLRIKEVRDETDRTGMRIVIELENNEDYDTVRKFLFKNTSLQISYNYNNVVIVDKRPQLLGIVPILRAYLNHYIDVLLKRTKYDLEKAKKRLEIIAGLVKAISIIDQVISTIRKSANRSEAIQNLIKSFEFTEVQATAIVDLRLYRLTSTDIVKLQEEKANLELLVNKLNAILNDKNEMNKEIIADLSTVRDEFGIDRRTVIVDEVESIDIEIEKTIEKKDLHLWISHDGYLKAIDIDTFEKSNMKDFKRKPGDTYIAKFKANTVDTVLLVSNLGKYYVIPVYKIEESKWKTIGIHLNKIVQMSGAENIISAFLVKDFDNAKQEIMLATKQGMIKRTKIENLKVKLTSKSYKLMNIKQGDEVVSATLISSKTKYAIMLTRSGYAVKYNIDEIPSVSSSAKGVKSTSSKNEEIISGIGYDDGNLILVTDKGYCKKVGVDLIPTLSRPKKGIRLYPKNNKIEEYCVNLLNVDPNNKEIVLFDDNGEMSSVNIDNLPDSKLEARNVKLEGASGRYVEDIKQYIVESNDIPIPSKSTDLPTK